MCVFYTVACTCLNRSTFAEDISLDFVPAYILLLSFLVGLWTLSNVKFLCCYQVGFSFTAFLLIWYTLCLDAWMEVNTARKLFLGEEGIFRKNT